MLEMLNTLSLFKIQPAALVGNAGMGMNCEWWDLYEMQHYNLMNTWLKVCEDRPEGDSNACVC